VTVRAGRDWGSPADGPPDLLVAGGDRELAEALAGGPPDPLVRFTPSAGSDLARALGLRASEAAGVAAPVDLLRPRGGGVAVNAVVVGTAPDRLRWWHRRRPMTVEVDGRTAFAGRACTVAVLNGQYLRGADLSPRGHPGDGWAEVQVYGLPPAQRSGLRRRLLTGSHLPHPDITTRRGRSVAVRLSRPARLELDGRPAGRVSSLDVEVVPGAYRLLV
jgi:YegS C-terminal NAD kinase beta sandwich-like domain